MAHQLPVRIIESFLLALLQQIDNLTKRTLLLTENQTLRVHNPILNSDMDTAESQYITAEEACAATTVAINFREVVTPLIVWKSCKVAY